MFMKEEHRSHNHTWKGGEGGSAHTLVMLNVSQVVTAMEGAQVSKTSSITLVRKKKYIVYTRRKSAGSSGCGTRTTKERGGHLRNGVHCVHS
jgi:hypothetical protein